VETQETDHNNVNAVPPAAPKPIVSIQVPRARVRAADPPALTSIPTTKRRISAGWRRSLPR
jgi:hypothetical protein